ncbi:hypothetical protein BACCIP111883_03655 [Sutcliffiella rhizosphaerae]|uniref:Uncharacterized protein n=1 Tax=Sutcliffiella rhizosphaerae TaxID=2880967 RepID=A0ABM8YSP5_9BACI|nr:hypothetical protein BACCIP111883_03655 [Sutcliffiella rhizosphaerae]
MSKHLFFVKLSFPGFQNFNFNNKIGKRVEDFGDVFVGFSTTFFVLFSFMKTFSLLFS